MVPDLIFDFSASKMYNSTNMNSNIVDLFGFGGASMCTFLKDGKKYGGIHFYFSPTNHEYVFFDGYTNFDVFGLDYYDTRGTVLNDEVHNSLILI